MDINEEKHSARRVLNELNRTETKRRSSLKELIDEIVEDVLETMRAGVTLKAIVDALNENRDDQNLINPLTFRNYLQEIRIEKGLPPVQPKNKMAAKSSRQKAKINSQKVTQKPLISAPNKLNRQDGFRHQGGDL